MDQQRLERFEEEVSGLNAPGAASREPLFARVGLAAAVIGPLIGVVAYVGSYSADDALQQRDMIVLGLLGVSITVLGVGLFLRHSVVRFFRFWAARVVYALENASGADSADG